MLLAQISDAFWRGWLYVTHTRSLAIGLGVGFAILAIVLLIASRTRWGQAKPLTKCVILSVLAHVWLLMYALGGRSVLPQGSPDGRDTNLSVAFESQATFVPLLPSPSQAAQVEQSHADDASAEPSESGDSFAPQPWERSAALGELPQPEVLHELLTRSKLAAPALLAITEPTPLPPLPEARSAVVKPSEASQSASHTSSPASPLAAASNSQTPADSSPPSTNATPESSGGQSALAAESRAQPGERPASDLQSEVVPPTMPPAALAASPSAAARSQAALPVSASQSTVLPQQIQLPPDAQLPPEYQLRQAINRLQLATAFGADQDSEAAVEAGLAWLAAAQSSDGSWDAQHFGGGTETRALGESRYGTGEKADTGVSGLALLAFLSAGHTHLHGKYQSNVQQGLGYLLRAQMPSGDLSGPKQVGSDRGVLNARMYCHSIATLALAEAHVMTGDGAIRDSLIRAAQYSINAQDPRGGGWRYRPRDPGDMSQFGWQAMALKSVGRSGIAVPRDVTQRMHSFIDSCTTGRAGGLFTYRPKEGWPSETMTAEGLACRLLIDYPPSAAAQQEALSMIMERRPGVGEDNVYFWYYATLALFQLQDENWRQWNAALKQRLLATQQPAYAEQPGSWNPDGLWGGYGGRVYSTAMSCLCLEVYYRFLPMYQNANIARTQAAWQTQR